MTPFLKIVAQDLIPISLQMAQIKEHGGDVLFAEMNGKLK
jgi:hypothetical protein